MRYFGVFLGFISLASLSCVSLLGTPAGGFTESDGYIVMEMESVTFPENHNDLWIVDTALEGFTGNGYLQFKGNGICSGPAGDPQLSYPFTITTGGTYYLGLYCARIWHCVVGDDHSCDWGSYPNDETCPSGQFLRKDLSNDAFVSIHDADGNYVSYNGQNANSVGNPTKMFGGANNEFGWTGNTSLDQGGFFAPEWDLAAGTYELIIQGRSQDFRIDKMMLFNTDMHAVRDARNNVEDGTWTEAR